MRQLLNVQQGGIEGSYALARAAVAAKQWSEARRMLEPVIAAGEPQARFCMLMADLEEGETGDKGKAREWLSRAIRAQRDPMWVVDGIAVPQWIPVSPVTGEIAEAQWKVPFALLPGEASPPSEPAEAEPVKEAAAEPERIAAPPPAAPEPSAATTPRRPLASPRPAVVTPVRPPDDPGPSGGDGFTGMSPAFADS